MDLTNCIKAPMTASLPHFYDADPELLKHVKGLNPDAEQHEIQIDFEPVSSILRYRLGVSEISAISNRWFLY